MAMDSNPPAKRYRRDETADPTNPNPSIVVHVRNLSPKATEADLLEALSHFGPIAYATCFSSRRMALVEFEELDSARRCVVFAQTTPINVAGHAALFNYSTSQAIQRIGLESEHPNHILVLTIYNAHYPINVDVIHQICSPHGQVLRIAMIKRSMVQALVEFDSMEVAKKTKHAINGADIYSGCCTLKVEFAKPDHVKVTRNDQDQWDYTMKEGGRRALISDGPPTGGGPPISSRRGGPMSLGGGGGGLPPSAAPIGGTSYSPYDDYANVAPYYADRKPDFGAFGGGGGYHDGGGGYREGSGNVGGGHYEPRSRGASLRGGPPLSAMDSGFLYDNAIQETAVLMIYGVDHENFNCTKIFNLLCCYGNCLKVKFMMKKQDTCMVEMNNTQSLNNAITFLQNLHVFGKTLQLRRSKQNTLREMHEPFDLPDGTSSFMDFTRNRNHRFSNPDMAKRNRLGYPSNQLHWFNAPTTMNEDRLKKIFAEKGMPEPKSVTIFNTRSERSSSGLVELDSLEEAAEALMIVNHVAIHETTGKPPYTLKLAFSDGK